ncbi:MAG TPA: pitrilysin family protein [Longimicrobium sp.]|jgi:predicted Zn-dependent peptidase|uniref:M16 family metallopeptidase n=1 Tax=Longimicrobium sp. TaxID=2029185 RepID=UPI002ED89299
MQIPIEQYTLENGLRVVLSRDDALPIVAVNLWYSVGSRDERPGRTGLAHLFEHMMFQGSLNVSDTQHIQMVERVGGTINASTWLDRTNYYTILPSSHLELALWLDADRMAGFVAALTQEKFDNQREVVKNERRQRVDNAPYGDWDERLQRLVWPEDHPYHHSVIGSMEDLDAASLDDVANFFRTYYAPNNAVLTLCGDFEPDEARRMIERHFGPVPRGPEVPALPGQPVIAPIPLAAEVRERVESAVALSRVYVAWRIPPYGAPEYYVADLLSELLAGGKSARMYRSLVREQRLTASVGAFVFPVVTGASAFVLRGNALPGQAPEPLEEAMMAELREVAETPPTPAEMERAMTGLEARRILELQKVSERADNISMMATYFGDPGLINTELERYRGLTAHDVQAFVRTYLNPDNRVVLTYVPQPAAEAA